jgi:hypothetical protein
MGLFNLIFTIGANTRPFEQGMKKVGSEVGGIASSINARLAGIFSVGAMTAWAKSVVDTTSRFKDLSEQTGMTTDEVQKIDFAMAQSGLAFEDVTRSLTRLSSARRDAVEGNMELRKTFEKFGLSVRDLNDPQKRNVDLLLEISQKMATVNATAGTQTQIMDILGEKAGKLAFILRDLSTFKPPALISKFDIEQIDKATKALAALKIQSQAAAAPGASVLADAGRGALRFGMDSIKDLFGRLTGQAPVNNRKSLVEEVAGGVIAPRSVEPFAEAIAKGLGNFLNIGMGGDGRAQPLFQEGKNIKEDAFKSTFKMAKSDSLTAVGNFLGGDPTADLRQEVKTMTKRLTDIERHTKKLANGAVVIKK